MTLLYNSHIVYGD